MLNYFARKKLSFTKKMPPSPAYNLVYNTIPPKELLTKNQLVNLVIQRDRKEATLQKEKIIFVDEKAVSNVIEEMVKQGFIKEITGTQLEKIIDT